MSGTFAEYSAAGFALVPIPLGQKGPRHKGWNARERCRLPANWTGNVGLAHAYSETCAIDVDDLDAARAWLAPQNVDLDALLSAPDAVRISSGRPNRAKLLYRLTTPLRSKKIIIDKQSVIDFRCADSGDASLQDVLPPSTHPDTGKPYEWVLGVAADWRDPPAIPPALLAVWQAQLQPATKPEPAQAREPVELSRLEQLLAEHDPDCDRDQWVRTLAAIHYETQGSEEGLDLADVWSARGQKYQGRSDVETRWNSFKLDHTNPVTVASLRVDKPADPSEFEELPAETEAEQPKRLIVLRHIAQIIAERREVEWLLEDVLEAGVLGTLAAPRNTLKSFIANHWAHLAAVAGHGSVILSAEGRGLDRRSAAWFATHGPLIDPANVPLVALERAVTLNDKAVLAELCEAIEQLPWRLRLMVIDTLSKYSPGLDENDNPAMAAFLSRLSIGLRDRFGCTVLLVAHSGHSDPGRPRGASTLMANPDAEYIVNRPDPQGMLVTVTRERFKDAPSLPPLAYQAEVVDLGRLDQRGKAVTSLALREVAAPARSRPDPKGELQRQVLAAVRDSLPLDGGLVSVADVLDRATAAMPHDSQSKRDTRRQRALESLQALAGRGFLQIADDKVGLM